MAAAWIGEPDPLAGPVPATTVNGGSDLTVTNTTLLEHCLLEMADAAAGAGDGTADALGGGAEADVDALADDLEAQLVSRDEAGKLLGQTRRRRRLKEPKFSIIEAIGVESTSGSSTAGGDGGSIPLYRTYLICGPIRGWSDDGWWLSMLTTVRTLPALPCHEVYVQSVVHLVPGTYADDDDFCVRQVRRPGSDKVWRDVGHCRSEQLFRGLVEEQELDDADVRLILRQAANVVRRAAKRLADGYVALFGRRPASGDRVHCAALQVVLRQGSTAVVADYRRKSAAAMRLRWRLLLWAIGAGKVMLMRRILELNHGDAARGAGRRASRVRRSWGSTQMRLLPTPAQLREERRHGFDDEDRVPHLCFKRRGRRKLERWTYVRGSSTDGVRRCHCSDGREKWLRSHTNKYWQQADVASGDDADDVSADGEHGFYYSNENMKTEGCYAPMETDPDKLQELISVPLVPGERRWQRRGADPGCWLWCG